MYILLFAECFKSTLPLEVSHMVIYVRTLLTNARSLINKNKNGTKNYLTCAITCMYKIKLRIKEWKKIQGVEKL